ncbi:MAG: transposase, partial [Thermodesulfobacteriota bacterium]|nr:transposase [Thermodesulfobacteriota bacterium]
RLKCAKAKVEAIAMDMSPAYMSAVVENMKGVTIVFDHFHITKLINDKLAFVTMRSSKRRTQFIPETKTSDVAEKAGFFMSIPNIDNLLHILLENGSVISVISTQNG